MARADSPAPIRSSRPAVRRPGSAGTTATVAASAIAAKGTLIQNAEDHEKWSSSRPPSVGPATTAMPAIADQIPIAAGRSAGANTSERIDSVAGMTSAAPTPITARKAINSAAEPASAAAAEPAPNSTSPSMRPRRRPKRSPHAPATMTSAAKTSV
jgi:hypothetical protein